MNYIEYKNLCQGKRNYRFIRPKGCQLFLLIYLLIVGGVIFALFGCRGSYNTAMHKGYVTPPPAYLIAELPVIELPKPDTLIWTKKMRNRKVYFLPRYKRETNYYK